MKKIIITGAAQRVWENGRGEWQACYNCHKCAEEFATSSEHCRDEQTAREESDLMFDRQQRLFCCRCGYKLTDKEPYPEDGFIAGLNARIDKERGHSRELFERVQILQDVINGRSDAERIAVARGWIRMVPEVFEDELFGDEDDDDQEECDD